MQEFMDAIADAFGFYDDRDDDTAPGLNAVAAEFGITSLKTRKLLITAGVYSTSLSRQIAELAAGGYKIEQIADNENHRIKPGVCSLLPALHKDSVQPCRAVSQRRENTFIPGTEKKM